MALAQTSCLVWRTVCAHYSLVANMLIPRESVSRLMHSVRPRSLLAFLQVLATIQDHFESTDRGQKISQEDGRQDAHVPLRVSPSLCSSASSCLICPSSLSSETELHPESHCTIESRVAAATIPHVNGTRRVLGQSHPCQPPSVPWLPGSPNILSLQSVPIHPSSERHAGRVWCGVMWGRVPRCPENA